MGYTLYRCGTLRIVSGREALGSKEMAAFLPTFVAYLWRKRGIRIRLIKVADTERTANSAETHLGGWAIDIRTWDLTDRQLDLVIYDATRFGLILHGRTRQQGFDPHAHGMLNVGYETPCSYQINATRKGLDGLARRGRDLDKGTRPPQNLWLRASAGVEVMRAELAKLDNPAPSKPAVPGKPAPIKETDMPLTDADVNRIVAAVRSTPVIANGRKAGLVDHMAAGFVDDRSQITALSRMSAQLSALARKAGADVVDEKAIVAGVVAGISNQVRTAVANAVRAEFKDADGESVEHIANAVASELSERLVA